MATAGQVANFKRPVKTALHQAVLDGRIHQVRLLVSKHGVNVDSKDVFGRTPLMLACLFENEELGCRMARILLQSGSYVNIKDNMNRTALSFACMKGREKAVHRLLMDETIDINIPDNDGNTPLMHAALSGKPVIVRLLVTLIIRYSINIDIRNVMGYTALLLACKYRHFASAYIILKEGHASPLLRDNEFYCSARDWVNHSKNINDAYTNSMTKPVLAHSSTFSREYTMYSDTLTPRCNHTKRYTHPLGQSIDSAMRLPQIFSHFPETNEEDTIDGVNAKRALLAVIDNLQISPKSRQQVSAGANVHFSKPLTCPPSTPTLLAMSGRSHTMMMVPSLETIFKIYSEQCNNKPRPTTVPTKTYPDDSQKGAADSKIEPMITIRTPTGNATIAHAHV